jgi:hypothetical protein
MANITKYLASTIALLLLFYQGGFSQESEWIKKTSKDEKIAVNYRIYNSNDTDEQIIEYETITTFELDFEKCIEMMKEVSNHKDFSDETEESYKIKDVSENECLVYYFIDAPWPMPNSDCVSIMTYVIDRAAKTATFELIADADMYEMQDVRRMSMSLASYSFEELENGKVKIRVYTKFTPVASAPQWLIKTWFPDGPIDIMNNIIELIQEQS